MGYNRQEIEESLASSRYDDVFATYLLLGRKNTDVSLGFCLFFWDFFFYNTKITCTLVGTLFFLHKMEKPKSFIKNTFFNQFFLKQFKLLINLFLNSPNQTGPGQGLPYPFVMYLVVMLLQPVVIHLCKVQHIGVFIEVFLHQVLSQVGELQAEMKHYVS